MRFEGRLPIVGMPATGASSVIIRQHRPYHRYARDYRTGPSLFCTIHSESGRVAKIIYDPLGETHGSWLKDLLFLLYPGSIREESGRWVTPEGYVATTWDNKLTVSLPELATQQKPAYMRDDALQSLPDETQTDPIDSDE